MFEHFAKYKHIAVTGPQRSGTRIGAKAIAHDTGFEYIDEALIKIDSIYELYTILSWKLTPSVIQCPALCRVIHAVNDFDDALVVMMIRPISEIIESMERIGWKDDGWWNLEMALYADVACEQPSVPGRKYAHWHFIQRRLLPNAYDLYYHDPRESSIVGSAGGAQELGIFPNGGNE